MYKEELRIVREMVSKLDRNIEITRKYANRLLKLSGCYEGIYGVPLEETFGLRRKFRSIRIKLDRADKVGSSEQFLLVRDSAKDVFEIERLFLENFSDAFIQEARQYYKEI